MSYPVPKEPTNKQLKNGDAARRMHETIRLHQEMLSQDELMAGRYCAIRLSDGGSDNTAYDSREEAAKYQRHNMSRCAYFRIPPKGERWGIATCDSLLWYVKGCYDAGSRQDPAQQIIIPTRIEDVELP